jgi:hypothetical protein
MCASLFQYDLPLSFATKWLHDRLFEQKPDSFPMPVSPTRDFTLMLFTTKINATIRNIGDMIGWESDNNTVGPIAFAAKRSLLQFIPHMLPEDSDDLFYRLVLEHGDFGIHNMSITANSTDRPLITSLYDWEMGSIVPALLADPSMAVEADLVLDNDGMPSTRRLHEELPPSAQEQLLACSKTYFEVG